MRKVHDLTMAIQLIREAAVLQYEKAPEEAFAPPKKTKKVKQDVLLAAISTANWFEELQKETPDDAATIKTESMDEEPQPGPSQKPGPPPRSSARRRPAEKHSIFLKDKTKWDNTQSCEICTKYRQPNAN